jgi:hypothetical protein
VPSIAVPAISGAGDPGPMPGRSPGGRRSQAYATIATVAMAAIATARTIGRRWGGIRASVSSP